MHRRLLGLFIAALAAASCSSDEPDSPLVIGDVPSSYRIEYRIEDGDRRSSERLTVRRPFESRVETFDDTDDASGEPTVLEISSLGRSSRETAEGQRLAVAVPLSPPTGDVRIDVVLDDAVEAGLVERRDTKSILDRDCQVYRTGQTLLLVDLIPPGRERFVDVCIDAAGLVLEEVEIVDGDEARRRVAIDVELDPEVDDELFDVGERTVPIDRGGGAVREVTAASRTPGDFYELGDDLPLRHVGRFAVVPPQPDAFSDPTLRGRRIATLTDVLHDDRDLVTVERGGSLEASVELQRPDHAQRIEVGELDGDLELTALGPVITIELEGNRFLRVGGTLDVDEVAAVARGLRVVDGGELTPVGTAW